MERRTWIAAASIAAVALIAGCGGETRSRSEIRKGTTSTSATKNAVVPKKVDPSTAGTITGTVRWEGDVPKREALDVSTNADCARVVKEKIFKEELVVSDARTVKNVVISIDTNDVYETPADAALVDQIGCHYVPHVFALMASQKLKVKSSDQLSHNAHYTSTDPENGEDNIAMSVPMVKMVSFPKPDWIKFRCDVHPWMGAYCAVFSHPFFAISGDDGTYTIKNVPPGTYTLKLQHEKLPTQTASVTVETGKTATVDFTLKK